MYMHIAGGHYQDLFVGIPDGEAFDDDRDPWKYGTAGVDDLGKESLFLLEPS